MQSVTIQPSIVGDYTAAERKRRFRAKAGPGMCRTCTKNPVEEGTTKCFRCNYNAIKSVYAKRGKEMPPFATWKRKRIAKRKKS